MLNVSHVTKKYSKVLVFDHLVIASIGCIILNVALGMLFFALTPLFLEPKDGKKYIS